MLGFQVGLSGLRSSQAAMDTIANNIANANTPGYHRRLVSQVESAPVFDGNYWRGTGAEISRINQIASYTIESAYTQSVSDVSRIDESLNVARQLEIKLSGSEGSLNRKLDAFFGELQVLQGRPENTTQRNIVVKQSEGLTDELRSLASEVEQMKRTTASQLETEVNELNGKLARLGKLNKQISTAQAAGQNPLSLLDSHQLLVNEIAQSIDLAAVPQEVGFSYRFADGTVSISRRPLSIEAVFANDGSVELRQEGSDSSIEFSGGRLASYQDSLNSVLPAVSEQLDQLATSLITKFNHIQATGVAPSGPFSELSSTISVDDVDAPLSLAKLPFDVSSGELHISVYDTATKQRSLHSIAIDPATDSLSDLADKISGLDHIQAVVDSKTNQMTLIAEPGHGFDFSGQLPTTAERSNISGNANVRFEGLFQGESNQSFEFEIQGSGQIGAADDLTLLVTDEQGSQVGEFNIGSGYEPGSELDLGNGIIVRLDAGQLNAGDAFSVDGVADSDTSGVLVGLGINTYFEGTHAGNINVASAIVNQPDRLASGRSELAGDGGNITRFLNARSEKLLDDGGATFEEHVDGITSDVAILASHLSDAKEDSAISQANLLFEKEALSGVDPNEEMIEMLKYQRSFQAATRVITTIDETLQELMNMIR